LKVESINQAYARVKLGWAAFVLIASGAFLVSVFGYGFFPPTADEMTVAWMGKQTAIGRVPYRDFFAFLPPVIIYGLGGFFRVFGSSLAALRLLSVAWLAAATLLLFLMLRKRGMGDAWSALAALLVPGVLLTCWAVPSHHWFALGFGLFGLWIVSDDSPSKVMWASAGASVALAGLCVQSDGVLYAALLVLRAISGTHATDGGARMHALRWAGIGLAIPVALTVALLGSLGTLKVGIWDFVWWPLRYYKQAGGQNDVSPERTAAAIPGEVTLSVVTELAAVAIALSIPLLSLLSLPLGMLTRKRGAAGEHSGRSRWLFSAGGALLLWIIFLLGRMDLAHLVFFAPIALYLILQEVNWHGEKFRPRGLRVWLVAAVGVGIVFPWAVRWHSQPPSVTAVLAVDDRFRAASVPSLVDLLPNAREAQLPVLFLSKAGAALYFYHAPVPPPFDWITEPSARYTTDTQYAVIRDFADEMKVPYIVTPTAFASEFLSTSSPLREMLTTRYRPMLETPWGIAFERTSDTRETVESRKSKVES
jgi:hypothetical protein